jgi:hypothetical protein
MQENYYDEFLDELKGALERKDVSRLDEILQSIHG